MRKILFLGVLLITVASVTQAQTFRGPDKSPLDKAYFPDHFAHDRKPGDAAIIRVTYSRPQANGRQLFGDLVPYGEVWRTGADEAPEIRFYRDVTIGGTKLPAGTYSLFTIPEKDSWTIIFNADLDYWGAYSYQKGQDAMRAQASVKKLDKPVDHFSIQFEEEGDDALMHLAWGDTVATLPIKI
ncbi:MAG: DUF2911 domain-containing protein [Tunicatimonas sp.]